MPICFDKFSGDFVGRVTPVPIPNTEVKPTGADDTAVFNCGKVGSRRIYIEKKPVRFERAFPRQRRGHLLNTDLTRGRGV